MKVFRDQGDYVVAMIYGSDVEWVRNVLAAGRCQLTVRRHTVELGDPRLVSDPDGRLIPTYVRPFMRALRVTDTCG